jgi:hypothetical protein
VAEESKTAPAAIPGPWEVIWLKGDKLGSPSEVCAAGTANRVAFLASDGSLGTARLIAAAPDLLAALKEVVRISDRKHDAWDAAREAIANAEGSGA